MIRGGNAPPSDIGKPPSSILVGEILEEYLKKSQPLGKYWKNIEKITTAGKTTVSTRVIHGGNAPPSDIGKLGFWLFFICHLRAPSFRPTFFRPILLGLG